MKQLRKYNPKRSLSRVGSSSSSLTLILVIGLAVIIYLLMKSRPVAAASYNNIETWKITWDEKTMLPLEVEVHRDAIRQ